MLSQYLPKCHSCYQSSLKIKKDIVIAILYLWIFSILLSNDYCFILGELFPCVSNKQTIRTRLLWYTFILCVEFVSEAYLTGINMYIWISCSQKVCLQGMARIYAINQTKCLIFLSIKSYNWTYILILSVTTCLCILN